MLAKIYSEMLIKTIFPNKSIFIQIDPIFQWYFDFKNHFQIDSFEDRKVKIIKEFIINCIHISFLRKVLLLRVVMA